MATTQKHLEKVERIARNAYERARREPLGRFYPTYRKGVGYVTYQHLAIDANLALLRDVTQANLDRVDPYYASLAAIARRRIAELQGTT